MDVFFILYWSKKYIEFASKVIYLRIVNYILCVQKQKRAVEAPFLLFSDRLFIVFPKQVLDEFAINLDDIVGPRTCGGSTGEEHGTTLVLIAE